MYYLIELGKSGDRKHLNISIKRKLLEYMWGTVSIIKILK